MKSSTFLRLAGVATGLGLAYLAQHLLSQPAASVVLLATLPAAVQNPANLAIVLLIAGAVLFGASVPPLQTAEPSPDPRRQSFRDHPAHASRPLFLAALLAYAGCIGIYLLGGESSPVRWLWLAAALLLLSSQTPWSALRHLPQRARRDGLGLLLPALLLLLAALLRFYKLGELPQDLHGDMASHGLQAQQLLANHFAALIGVGWADIPLPGFLPTALAMQLSGDQGTLGLGLASALGGVMAVWGTWVLLRVTTNRRTALIGTALLATSYTAIHFSRIAEYMDPVPFAVWSLAFLAVGLQRRTSLPFALSGLLTAWASLMYFSGRVVLVALAAFVLYLLLFDRRLLRANAIGLVWLGVGVLVGLGPMLLFFLQHPQSWLSRTQQVILFNPAVLEHSKNKYSVETMGQIMVEQVRRTLLVFNSGMDSSTQFGFPGALVDKITGPLVVLGVAAALAQLRRWGYGLLLVTLGTVLLLGGILADNPPFYPRLILALTPAVGLAAVAVDRAWQAVTDALGEETGRIVATVVIGGLMLIALMNWTLYYQATAHNGRPRALVGRYVSTLPADATICIVPDNEAGWIHGPEEREIDFFMNRRRGEIAPLDGDGRLQAPPAACSQPGAVWIVPVAKQTTLGELEAQHPGGARRSYGARLGDIAFFTYVLP